MRIKKIRDSKGGATWKKRSRCSGLESGRRDLSRLPRDTLYPHKLALFSPTSGGRLVGIIRSRTKTTEEEKIKKAKEENKWEENKEEENESAKNGRGRRMRRRSRIREEGRR
jgi:hypothetical protein